MINDHNFKKHYGQNFLVDGNVINKIISAIGASSADKIVEIGPGDGALTKELINRCKKLSIIEIDTSLADKLKNTYKENNNISIHNQDILETDLSELYEDKIKIVGNLPYNISTPILFHCIKYIEKITDCIFMLQKEVVERICAKHNESAYGRLSVVIQHLFTPSYLFTVSPNSFYPKPKVESAILHLAPKSNVSYADSIDDFNYIVKQSFSMRRKTLANNLKKIINIDLLENIGVNTKLRPENLSLNDYIHISNLYTKSKLS